MIDWIPDFEHIPNPGGGGGSYTGGPTKLTIHTFEIDPGHMDAALKVMRSRTSGVYHILADPATKRVIQLLPVNRASSALKNLAGGIQTNRDSSIQLCIIARAAHTQDFTTDDLMWLGWVVGNIKKHIPEINLDNFRTMYGANEGFVLASVKSPVRMPAHEWDNFNGVCGHQHVPENDHWDPGKLDIGAVIYFAKASLAPPPVSEAPERLLANQILEPGQSITSPNGGYTLILQTDGNLVLYTASWHPIWATRTHGQEAMLFVMQGDGNAVLYGRNNLPLWTSNTWGRPGAWIVVQDDGNLVIYDSHQQPLWATGVPVNNPTIHMDPMSYPTISRGSNGAAVMLLQEKLKALGVKIKVDGKFGKNTEKEIRNLQSFFGLGIDGIVGPRTWQLLDYLLSHRS